MTWGLPTSLELNKEYKEEVKMKKILLSVLLSLAVFSTFVCSQFSIKRVSADIVTIRVGSFAELQSAVNTANQTQGKYIFNFYDNLTISAEEKVFLYQSEVTLRGNGHTITVDSNLASVEDLFDPIEINNNCFFEVKGDAQLNIGTDDGNDKILLKHTNNNIYASDSKYIRRIGITSRDGVVNIYDGTQSALGYSVAGTLNIYGGIFTNFVGPYKDRNGIQLDYVITTYSNGGDASTANVNIFGGSIENNYARAINIEGNSKCLIEGDKGDPVVIKRNHIGFDGAGLLFNSLNTLTIKNALFKKNSCENEPVYRPQKGGFGAAVHVKSGSVEMKDSVFKENTNDKLDLYFSYINSTVTIDNSNYNITNCDIIDNKEGITLKNNASGTIQDSTISNTEDVGLNIKGTVNCNLKNTKITRNGRKELDYSFGGGILSNFAHNPSEVGLGPATINCDEKTMICNNKAKTAGADIFTENTKLTLPDVPARGQVFEETGEEIDGWYYDGYYPTIDDPPVKPERYGRTETPILAEIDPNEAKHYSIIAAHHYGPIEETTTPAVPTTKNVTTSGVITTQKNKISKRTITLKKASIKKIKAKRKSLKITWKKVKHITGYKIQYSLNKRFKKAKTIMIKKSSIVSKKIKKLKRKKKYYIRVRTYVVIGDNIYQTEWSKKKIKKTK